MNREEAKQLLPIIQAFADGKRAEFLRSDGEWVELKGEPDFSFPPDRYRIKTEPEVIWVNKFKGGDIYKYITEEEARHGTEGNEHLYEYIAKKFVEAIDD